MAEAGIVDLGQSGAWQNYHRTGTSQLLARYGLRSGDGGSGREDLRQAAAAVQDWLRRAQRQDVPVRPVGAAWSLPTSSSSRRGGC